MNYPSYSTKPRKQLVDLSKVQRPAVLIILGFIWFIAWLGINTPIGEGFENKLLFLLPPVGLSIIYALLNAPDAFAFWSIGLGLFVTQTGFQFNAGSLEISALEVVIVILLLLLFWLQRPGGIFENIHLLIPGKILWILFTVYSIAIFVIGVVRGDSVSLALMEFKGFLLYPLMALIFIAGIRNRNILKVAVWIFVAWYLPVAARGIYQYIQGIEVAEELVRASGDYAPTNLYGITLVSISLFTLGFSIYEESNWRKFSGILIAVFLFIGAAVSVARSIWVAYLLGVFFLLIFAKGKRTYLVMILLIMTLLLVFAPEQTRGRILQLTDSSTMKRQFYLESGVEAFKASPIVGWGWGKAYYFYKGIGLIPSAGIPWYHNDYLNLVVQVGLLGLLPYVGYWVSVVLASIRWIIKFRLSNLTPYVVGSTAGLVGFLVSAGFEQVMWRRDIAGVAGWLSGILLASMFLINSQNGEEPAPR